MTDDARRQRIATALLRLGAREGRRVTYRDMIGRVAALLGEPPVHEVTMGRWMRGEQEPTVAQALAIARTLGVDAFDLWVGATADAIARAAAEDVARQLAGGGDAPASAADAG